MIKFKYKPSMGFIAVLVVTGLLAKCNSDLFVPKTDLQVQRKVESKFIYETIQLERQLNKITYVERALFTKV